MLCFIDSEKNYSGSLDTMLAKLSTQCDHITTQKVNMKGREKNATMCLNNSQDCNIGKNEISEIQTFNIIGMVSTRSKYGITMMHHFELNSAIGNQNEHPPGTNFSI